MQLELSPGRDSGSYDVYYKGKKSAKSPSRPIGWVSKKGRYSGVLSTDPIPNVGTPKWRLHLSIISDRKPPIAGLRKTQLGYMTSWQYDREFYNIPDARRFLEAAGKAGKVPPDNYSDNRGYNPFAVVGDDVYFGERQVGIIRRDSRQSDYYSLSWRRPPERDYHGGRRFSSKKDAVDAATAGISAPNLGRPVGTAPTPKPKPAAKAASPKTVKPKETTAKMVKPKATVKSAKPKAEMKPKATAKAVKPKMAEAKKAGAAPKRRKPAHKAPVTAGTLPTVSIAR